MRAIFEHIDTSIAKGLDAGADYARTMSRGPEVIVTEKDNAARRIADILSGGSATAERLNDTNVYEWGGKRCIGLSGHVVGVDFPPE